jgi:hypothetical protein
MGLPTMVFHRWEAGSQITARRVRYQSGFGDINPHSKAIMLSDRLQQGVAIASDESSKQILLS